MHKKTLTIATRESPLAYCQANWVKHKLEARYPDLRVHLLGLTTRADKNLDIALNKIGGKGLFVKELEEALLQGRADIAVHSMKDVPMLLPAGLCIPAMCEREDPRDVFVSNQYQTLQTLPSMSLVATSSLRRQSQLYALKNHIHIVHLRGNVNSRLARLDKGEFTALILAAAGLKRLNLEKKIRAFFTPEEILPAAGQGALGIECREADEETKNLISPLNHAETFITVTAERALCHALGGNCDVPIGAYAKIKDNEIFLKGLVANPTGDVVLRAEGKGALNLAHLLGEKVARELIAKGAQNILNVVKGL